jgi:hypothetical protein
LTCCRLWPAQGRTYRTTCFSATSYPGVHQGHLQQTSCSTCTPSWSPASHQRILLPRRRRSPRLDSGMVTFTRSPRCSSTRASTRRGPSTFDAFLGARDKRCGAAGLAVPPPRRRGVRPRDAGELEVGHVHQAPADSRRDERGGCGEGGAPWTSCASCAMRVRSSVG